jgi:hypothetical protein
MAVDVGKIRRRHILLALRVPSARRLNGLPLCHNSWEANR